MTGLRPGTLRVLEPEGGLMVSPVEGMVVWFGRNRPDVHICIGPDDLGVSRRHGTLEYRAGCWWVRATGGRPVRLGRSHELWCGDEPVPLPDGRTSLQVEGTNPNEVHVLRVEVAAGSPVAPPRSERCGGRTDQVRGHPLKADERLVLTVIGQRVLRRDSGAGLLTCREAVTELEALQPGVWTPKKVEHLVRNVRDRLAAEGVKRVRPEPGDTRHDDSYRRNLVDELVRSSTLTPADLRLLGPDDG